MVALSKKGPVPKFGFDAQSWARIVEAMKGVSLDDAFRRELELQARILIFMRRSHEDRTLHSKFVASTNQIAHHGRLILEKLKDDPWIGRIVVDAAIGRFGGQLEQQRNQQRARFERELEALCHFCDRFQAKPKRDTSRIDTDRDRAWVEVAKLYVKVTGEPPSVTVNPLTSEGSGRIVWLLQAFMAGVPGESEPRPYQIRGS